MDEVYRISNASLVLRLIHYLTFNATIPIQFLTVIHQDMYWVIRLKCPDILSIHLQKDIDAFLREIGDPFVPKANICNALNDLEMGRSPVQVMRTYCVAVISHGNPSATEVNIFRQDFTARLGYCPCNLS